MRIYVVMDCSKATEPVMAFIEKQDALDFIEAIENRYIEEVELIEQIWWEYSNKFT